MTEEELAKVIAANVRAARKARSMTQAQLGDAASILTPHVSRLEKGSRLPSVSTLKRVADALDVPITSLLEEPDESIQKPKGKGKGKGKK